MKMKLSIIVIIILSLCLANYAEAQKKKSKTDAGPEFAKFFDEFKAAVLAGDANKLADMTKFPLLELEEVGSGNPSYSDRTKEDFFKYTVKNYFTDKKLIKQLASALPNKLKSTKLSGKQWFQDDDGNEVGKSLNDGQPIKTLKIGTKKEWTQYTFSQINGKYFLIMLEYHNPE